MTRTSIAIVAVFAALGTGSAVAADAMSPDSAHGKTAPIRGWVVPR